MTLTGREQQRLLERARSGDAEAFAHLFEEFRALVFSITARLVGPSDCEDVAMETFLRAWQALPEFQGRASLKNWLCRIAHNACMDWLRRRQREDARRVSQEDPQAAPLVESAPAGVAAQPDAQAQLQDLRDDLRRALDELSPEHRTVILLREVDGLSYGEIAAATGVRIGTVMSRLFHARRRLRLALAKEYGVT